ncbi:MAG: hypothetical protein J2P55_17635 [Rhizobiales bacterium]|nr:hypothetical protein [Hyphomicrobiales bacterium]
MSHLISAGDRDHLGIWIALGAAKLRRPDLVGGAQREQRHPSAAWLDHDYPLAPAERQTADPGDIGFGHRPTDPRSASTATGPSG